MKNRLIFWLPLLFFGLLLVAFSVGLMQPDNDFIASKMIGKRLPQFSLPAATPARPGLGSGDFATGEPQLLNIFASWCVPCIAEAPQLLALQRAGVTINAIAIRDRPQDVANFLARWGDPYARIGSDSRGVVQLELGSSGVPETFVIDGKGVIVHQHIGDIRAPDVAKLLTILAATR